MIFEFIGGQLASYSSKKSFDRIFDAVHALLNNEHAFNFAREELRGKYEKTLAPASYEHVVSNLHLTRDDFIYFFRKRPVSSSLVDHLRQQLHKRSDSWIYNRPNDEVFTSLINDFLDAYQRYFLSTDPLLATLNISDASQEILEVVLEIRNAMKAASSEQPDKSAKQTRPSLAKEIRSFLTILNVPFEIIDEQPDRIDVLVIDPSSVFPNRFLLCVRATVDTAEAVDEIAAISKLHPNVSNTLLVGLSPLTYEIAEYAERRRISVNSLKEFKETFYKLSPLERYVLGSLASRALVESLNIHEIYIEPDAIPVIPGDQMEERFLDIRQSATKLIESFLKNDSANIMFVLGGYGSGKSAFCAHLMQVLQAAEITPVYFALRQLRSADDLLTIVTKADQLAKTLGEGKRQPLVILDGLDELPNAMNGVEKKQNMLRLLEAATRTDKILITARTSYFRGIEDFWHLFRRPHDTLLWHEMAKFIPESGRRPNVGAMILREFNTDQIEQYIEEFAHSRGLEKSFADTFLSQMKSHDFGFNYMMLVRSPLYLFLIVNSRPWASSDVNCLADIFSLFVKYWLERDIEKGRSRWGLTTDDRLDFMTAVAWKMFQERRHAVTFNEFDACVRRFIGQGPKDEDYVSLGLDLQTTGIFNCVGNVLQFFAPGFLDYFVVKVFSDAAFPKDDLPRRLPTVDQVSMWAGLAETHKKGFEYEEPIRLIKGAYSREPFNAGAYLQGLGIENLRDLYGKIHLEPGRIIYRLPPGEWNWPYLNAADHNPASKPDLGRRNLRIVINAVLQRVQADKWTEIRLRIMNRKGLHARATAKVVLAYDRWRGDFIGREAPEITARREGAPEETVGLDSIMGLLTLGAGPGSTLIIEYGKCTRGEVEALLELMECKQDDEPGLWSSHLWEIDTDSSAPASEMMVGRFKPQ